MLIAKCHRPITLQSTNIIALVVKRDRTFLDLAASSDYKVIWKGRIAPNLGARTLRVAKCFRRAAPVPLSSSKSPGLLNICAISTPTQLTIDEPAGELGRKLCLPPAIEEQRIEIERYIALRPAPTPILPA